MFTGREGAVTTPVFFLGVQVIEPGLDFDGWVVGEVCGCENVFEVVDPLDVRDGTPPRDDDVAASQPLDLVVISGYRHVAHPVGVWAPHAGERGFLEEVWEVDVGGGVEVAAYGVSLLLHVKLLEEV